ncbi:cupin domain-containing protein [Sphingomonas xinjiangensis]|uniref:Quercetin dioxygenase-like cupin family protein n=1 Tax=Sphingomonas xinjiangensis TaxID=643568 RepID=A0A840YBT3_9SPHN|nr:cupin domain-containing protein [Sphingomonas xinjiangensis]MBB5709755.1 quercetin dioxygenase-like cupin family protein [Sphingomonas xinjiangensis]
MKLIRSRRRKPGGDYGLFGLEDAAGKPVLGVEDGVLSATYEEVEAYLRGRLHADWAQSAGTPTKRFPRRQDTVQPPKPRFKPEVANLLKPLPPATDGEVFTPLLDAPSFKVERIVSHGQSTPNDQPMVQDRDEWVLLLEGAAGIRVEDSQVITLKPGDHLRIGKGQPHWVAWTATDRPTVWLAIHLD